MEVVVRLTYLISKSFLLMFLKWCTDFVQLLLQFHLIFQKLIFNFFYHHVKQPSYLYLLFNLKLNVFKNDVAVFLLIPAISAASAVVSPSLQHFVKMWFFSQLVIQYVNLRYPLEWIIGVLVDIYGASRNIYSS